MKTTIELPDALFRQVKAHAAAHGVTLKHFFTQAVTQQLRRGTLEYREPDAEPPWMEGFGGLSDLGDEHRRILETIEDEFERLAPEDLE